MLKKREDFEKKEMEMHEKMNHFENRKQEENI